MGARAPHIAAMHNSPSSLPSERILIEAIARRRVIRADYNGAEHALAPHALFSRHGALFVSALNTRRVRRNGEEPRPGMFKLDGLSSIVVTDELFEAPKGDFTSGLREGDAIVFAV